MTPKVTAVLKLTLDAILIYIDNIKKYNNLIFSCKLY